MIDPIEAFVDVADGLLFGIPSTVLLQDVSRKYNIEIADLQRTYDLLQQELNNNSELRADIENKQYKMLNTMSDMSPLGAWRQTLQDKYNQLDRHKENLASQSKAISDKLVDTSNKLTKKQLEANSNTLGKQAVKVIYNV